MKQLYAFLFLTFTLSFTATAQTNIPLNVLMLAQKQATGSSIGLLVKGNTAQVAAAVKKHGGHVRQSSGAISSVQLPVAAITAFAAEPGILEIGHAPVALQLLNDTMRTQSRVDEVHNGLAPLTQGYTGRNVVMGIMDSGIDFNHPDFKDSLGNSRIYALWDQRDNAGPGPAPFNYGTLWTQAQINGGSCLHNDLQYYGHGTHVSGIAAGNGRATNVRNYKGVAPDAIIVAVAIDFTGSNSPTAIADATAWMYAQAQTLGLPCVINASLGDYYGSHDGQDLQAQLMDNLITAQSGRVFVGAAGNAGDLDIHLSYPLTAADTALTWFTVASGNIYMQLWIDTNAAANAHFAVGTTATTSWTDRGRTPFTTIAQNLSGIGADTVYNAQGQRLGIVQRAATVQGSAYSLEFLVQPDSLSGYGWSLEATGSGVFHSWSFDFVPNSSLPPQAVYPRMSAYRMPDRISTLVSSFQCSDKVITVGNYVNRSRWPDVNNVWQTDATVTAGDIMSNSSRGPTRTGRTKPEIAAPGANNFSCAVISTLPNFITNAPQVVALGGYHIQGGGTSAASPVVAGAAALCLQHTPGADWLQVRNALLYCTRNDTFTGPVATAPDNTWGYGKLDAFAALTNCFLTTTGPEPLAGEMSNVFPNPAAAGQPVTLQLAQPATQIEVMNMLGEIVLTQTAASAQNTITLHTEKLPPGLYLLRTPAGTVSRLVIR
ncbi:MAG: S8 family peptidase [Bacteroidia bacterium]|jgi:subtilisin family serine protease|nr:S8 family peptidase [Bacteroidia bacterium]